MCRKFAASMPLLSKKVSRFLADWLIHHIKDEDQQVIHFLRQTLDQQALSDTAEFSV